MFSNTRPLFLPIRLLICSILGITLLHSCDQTPDNGLPEITYAQPSDFDTSQVSVELREGLRLSIWAPGPLLRNAVAIDFDNQGVAYVSETNRRKSSDIDIREHRNWMTEDIGLSSLEATEAFHKAKLDPSFSAQNTWQEDLNGDGSHDWHDLMVQSEYIRRIWDQDGDGRADASSIYAQDFNGLLTGTAAGILEQGNSVYLTVAPDLWRLEDLDGDGDADQRESISHGYGIHIAYAGHDMSGLTMGPDGKVYWSIGDIGVNVTDARGQHWEYPHEGAVMRCNPDGSEFEVFAHGLRNPQELAFDAFGNLISVDNDGDHPGEHERFVHILEGSDTGWRTYWQFGKYDQPNEEYKVWMDEGLHLPQFSGRPAYVLPPLALAPDGPAGLAYNPGTAMGAGWEQTFFGSYFKGSAARSQIQAFRLEPRGASFRVAEQIDVIQGIASTGLAWGPDGALYINDWQDGYDKKTQGRIWKLDVEKNPHPLRAETKQLLAEGMADRNTAELQTLLAHADMRVRMEAQFELVKRKESEVLVQAATQSPTLYGQIHGIWGLGQLARQAESNAALLLPFLKAEQEQVRAQTAKVLGDAHYAPAMVHLRPLLNDADPQVQLHTVQALGKLGDQQSFDQLVTMLATTEDKDPHLRFALAFALSQIDQEEALVALADHPSPHVRLGAVVALRQLRAPGLAQFLQDTESAVSTEAARAIHDDRSVPEALPALAQALEQSPNQEEAFLRRAINANLRIGDAAAATRLANYASRMDAPLPMRADALWALGTWPEPPVLDRVEGRYRVLPDHAPDDARLAFARVSGPLVAAGSPVGIRAAAAEAMGRLGYTAEAEKLKAWVLNPREDPQVRRAALQSLAQISSPFTQEAITIALNDRSIDLRTDAQALISTMDLPPTTVVSMLQTVLEKGTVPEQQQALAGLSPLDVPEAEVLLGQWLAKLQNQQVPPALQLDVYTAVAESPRPGLAEALKTYETGKNTADPLDLYRESLAGGVERRGQRLFYRNNSAQCIRCHQIEGLGGQVGPDLSHIATVLSPEELLASMVAPSARLAPGYGTVMLSLKDGAKLVGTWLGEDAQTIRYRDSEGTEKTISKAEIQTREMAPSAMPAMQTLLSRSEIRDLVAFLVSLK